MIFSLLLVGLLAHAEKPLCSQTVENACRYLETRKSEQYIYLDDGTYFRNPAYDKSWWSYVYESHGVGRLTSKRASRLQEIFAEVRDKMIADLQADDGVENENARNLVKRLQKVHFDAKESDAYNGVGCATFSPNAGYDSANVQTILCHSASMLPDSSIYYILGHELGHSIGPCDSQFPVHDMGNGKYQTDIDVEFDPSVKKNAAPIFAEALSPAQHPLHAIVSCLRDQGFSYTLTDSDINQLTGQILKILGKSDPATQASVKRRISDKADCFSKEGMGNPVDEAHSDVWGTRMVAEYYRHHPPRNELDKVAMLSPFIDTLCGNGKDSGKGDAHAPTRERIEKIIMTSPEIKQALGCDGGNSCDPGPHSSTPGNADDSTVR